LVILCNSEIGDNLSEIQEEICTALIPGFNKDGKEAQADIQSAEEQQIPEEFLGKWEGKIVAYDREIDIELKVNKTDGAIIGLSGQQESKIDLAVITDDFMLGYFSGVIPTPDAERYPGNTRLALVRQGNKISGQATADQWVEERQMRYELSSWIESPRAHSPLLAAG